MQVLVHVETLGEFLCHACIAEEVALGLFGIIVGDRCDDGRDVLGGDDVAADHRLGGVECRQKLRVELAVRL